MSSGGTASNVQVLEKLVELYGDAFQHDGFAEIRVELRILRRGQKEVILHCGKQYRFVVDCAAPSAPSSTLSTLASSSGLAAP